MQGASFDVYNETPASRALVPRVINRCGVDLQRAGLISLSDEVMSAVASGTLAECIKQNDAFYKEIEEDADGNYESDAQKESAFLGQTSCFGQQSARQHAYRFPFHLFIAGGGAEFQRKIAGLNNGKDVLEYLDESLAAVNGDLRVAIDSESAYKNKKAEEEALEEQAVYDKIRRVEAVKNGELSGAESCQDFADALVENSFSRTFGYTISSDSQDVKIEPTGEVYASVGTLVSYEEGYGITFDVNSLTQEKYSALLRFDNATWFNKAGVSLGKKIYYVGRYASNEQLKDGNGEIFYARGYDVICASSI